jgi:hypothetical protein
MRNYCLVLLGLICLGSVWTPQARAQQYPSQVEEQQDPDQLEEQQDLSQAEEQLDPAQPAAPASPEPLDREAKIRLKRNELKAVEKEIKALRSMQKGEREAEEIKRRGEKQSRLEALKLEDPLKYQEELAKQYERERQREKVRQEKIADGLTKPKMTHEQWLEYIMKRNPKMYELVVKKDRLQNEIKNIK